MRQRDIFKFWLPLFASWLLMTAEGPTISAAINRLPNEVVMLAAQGIVISLSVTIESPIISLLSTATALTKDRHSFLLIRKFTIHWMIGLTIVTVLIGFTPLFDVIVVQWMGTPEEIARWVRPGMQIMSLWSAAIAWRRFLQGVLIQFGYTRRVAWGTVIRLISSAGTVVVLSVWSSLPGIVIGGCAWMAGVGSEAIYATFAVRSLLKNELSPTAPSAPGDPLTYSRLFWFHLPLAGTSLLTLLAQPLVAFSLARLDNPTQSLAAWPLIFQVLLMARAAAFALPEVVIALTKGRETYAPLRRFAMTLMLITTGIMALLVFTPLISVYLFTVQDADPAVGELARWGVLLFLVLPSLTVVVSWVRGLLISNHATTTINIGMAINLLLTAVILLTGVSLQTLGIATASAALNVALVVELVYLLWQAERSMQILPRLNPRSA